MKESFSALSQLLGCYLHQDWPDEFASDVEALQAIVEFEPLDQVKAGVDELERLLSAHRSEAELRKVLVDEIGCYFEPESDGISYREWLSRVLEIFSRACLPRR